MTYDALNLPRVPGHYWHIYEDEYRDIYLALRKGQHRRLLPEGLRANVISQALIYRASPGKSQPLTSDEIERAADHLVQEYEDFHHRHIFLGVYSA